MHEEKSLKQRLTALFRRQSWKLCILSAGALLSIPLYFLLLRGSAAGAEETLWQEELPVLSASVSSVPTEISEPIRTTAKKPGFPVELAGCVRYPGVYLVQEGDYLQILLEQAGGFTAEAEPVALNLAARLKPHTKIYVPSKSEWADKQKNTGQASDTASAGIGLPNAEEEQKPRGPALVNINTANQAELETLPGIGASTAKTILRDRESRGPFKSIEDLMRVPGIKKGRWEKLKDYICVD